VRIEAIIFDLDGLMVDSEPLAREAWCTLLAENGHSLDDETFDVMLGLRLMDSTRVIQERFSLPVTAEQIAERRVEIFLGLLEDKLSPRPGLAELLAAVEVRGLRRAVATSSSRLQVAATLRKIGVADFFEAVVTGDSVVNGKPAPDIYQAAMTALGKTADACLALEDSPVGVQAAKAAGMRCIAVPSPESAGLDLSQADVILPSLAAVAQRLDELLAK
jgi:HAD superfamily hydrolase (TIGR01509 family)